MINIPTLNKDNFQRKYEAVKTIAKIETFGGLTKDLNDAKDEFRKTPKKK